MLLIHYLKTVHVKREMLSSVTGKFNFSELRKVSFWEEKEKSKLNLIHTFFLWWIPDIWQNLIHCCSSNLQLKCACASLAIHGSLKQRIHSIFSHLDPITWQKLSSPLRNQPTVASFDKKIRLIKGKCACTFVEKRLFQPHQWPLRDWWGLLEILNDTGFIKKWTIPFGKVRSDRFTKSPPPPDRITKTRTTDKTRSSKHLFLPSKHIRKKKKHPGS